MGNALGIHPVASMGLAGDCSLGVPWHGSMGNALGCHGLALGLAIGNSMGVLYGKVMVMCTGESHGLAWVMLHRSAMEVPHV